MTTYRLWPSTNGGSLSSYAGPFVGATQFGVYGGGNWLNGYYIWVPTGGDPTATYNTALWSLNNSASSGSGVLVPNSVVTGVTGLTANAWNYIALPAPIQLAASWDKNSTANGSIYCAAVGWTAVNGFADTNGYWASGGGGGNGITNGPLIGYSSNTGASNVAPYGMAQGLFSSSTSNAASAMPNQVSGTDNFWVDVQISNVAPASYSGSYRIWPNKYDTNDFTTGDQPSPGENYTVATEISLSQACTLNNVWYWSPNGLNGSTTATTLATRCDVWNVSTGLSVASITSPTWLKPDGTSGSAGAGWLKAAFAGGVTLPAGDYRVSVYNSAGTTDINWNAKDASTDYFGETATNSVGAAGITNGPITAVGWTSSSSGFVYNSGGAANTPPYSGSASSHTQPPFYQPNPNTGAVGFPQLYAPVGGSSNQTQNYWIDLEVTPIPAMPGGWETGSLTPPGLGSPMAWAQVLPPPQYQAQEQPPAIQAGAVETMSLIPPGLQSPMAWAPYQPPPYATQIPPVVVPVVTALVAQPPPVRRSPPQRARLGGRGLVAAGIIGAVGVVPGQAPKPYPVSHPAPQRAHAGPLGRNAAGQGSTQNHGQGVTPPGGLPRIPHPQPARLIWRLGTGPVNHGWTPPPLWHPQPRRPGPVRAIGKGQPGGANASVTFVAVGPPAWHPQPRTVPPRRALVRSVQGGPNRGFAPPPGVQPQIRHPQPQRALWRGLAALPPRPGPPRQQFTQPRRPGPLRALWRGGAVQPTVVQVPRQRLTIPRRLLARVLWRGTTVRTVNTAAVAPQQGMATVVNTLAATATIKNGLAATATISDTLAGTATISDTLAGTATIKNNLAGTATIVDTL